MKKQPKIPTTERLALALEDLITDKPAPALAAIIAKARAGYYDDFKSQLTMPTVQLFNDLVAAGYTDMAERVLAGEFDATAEESAEWMQREGWSHLLGRSHEPAYVELAAADPHIVKAIMDHLLTAFNGFIDAYPGTVDYIDGLMGFHNAYKVLILDLEKRTGRNDWRKIAIATLEMALGKPKEDNRDNET